MRKDKLSTFSTCGGERISYFPLLDQNLDLRNGVWTGTIPLTRYVSSKLICWNPIPELGLGGRTFMNEISAKTPERSLALFTVWHHSVRMAVYIPGGRPSPDTRCGHGAPFILAFPASRTVRIKLLVLRNTICDILLQQPRVKQTVTWSWLAGSCPNHLFLALRLVPGT
jgi:hypothetical protein